MSRKEMDEQLARRTEQSYDSREKGGKFQGVFKEDVNISSWFMEKGEHLFDIIPYQAGENDPVANAGEFSYWLDIYVHRNVGPRDLQFICLEQTFSKACPICEYRNELRKDAPDGERQKEAHKKKTDELNWSRRCVYNVWVQDNREEIKKGVQVLEIAHWFMEKHLSALAKVPRARGGGYISFAHPEKGKTVSVIRTGVGATSTGYDGYQFVDRDYDIPDDILDEAHTLDDLIHIPTYREVKDAFWDEGGGEESGEEEEPRGRQTRGRDQGEDEEPHPRKRKHYADEGDGADDAQPRTRNAEFEVEEEEPRPRRRRPAEEDVGDSRYGEDQELRPRKRRPVEEEEEPAPRRRRAQTEEEEEPAPRGGSKFKKLGTDKKKCPVPGGVFGDDADQFDDCETCKLWDPCIKAKGKAKRDED